MTQANNLVVFTFIDALGWEVLKGRPFMEDELPNRQKLKSVFGYSSACVPSILSGMTPAQHGHWSFYYLNRQSSPFAGFKWMQYLPLTARGRIRHQLSKLVKKKLGWEGYFQLYNMPFEHLHLFDYCEKQNIFAPGGLNRGTSIVDQLDDAGVPFHISDWHRSEEENIRSLKRDIAGEEIQFAFLYMADMDALLHQVGKHSELVDQKLAWYEEQLRELLTLARQHYDNVTLHVCSDHGMATVNESINLGADIEATGLTFGHDYVAAYDSTMARFWFLRDGARATIEKALAGIRQGQILEETTLKQWGCDFQDERYGEMIFLLDPGVIICPSHMGTKPITGMHGYSPEDPDSDAVLLSSRKPGRKTESIIDLNALMHAELAA